MPIYIYQHPKNGKTVEIFQGMNDEHTYKDKKGVEWRRVFTAPTASIDANIDPFSEQAFIEKTGKNKGTVGDLWDRSKEMSLKRAEKRDGEDPVMKAYYKAATKKRKGKKSFHELQSQAKSVSGLL